MSQSTIDNLAKAIGADNDFIAETRKGMYESDIESYKQVLVELDVPVDIAAERVEQVIAWTDAALLEESKNDVSTMVYNALIEAGITDEEVNEYAMYLNSDVYKLIESTITETLVQNAIDSLDRLDNLAASLGIIEDNRTLN
jgi:hypothetical protein